MRTGLILGKFAPLHRGHQYVIDTALREMERVIVMIYDVPEVTTCPLPVRTNWLRQLYPQVEIIEAWDGPTTVSDDPAITRLHDEYLQQTLAGRGVSHFYSSEFYGAHVSRALGAEDRRVDPERRTICVSATRIRENPFEHREFLDPLVYRDLITRVVLLGAPSTGKTTLAAHLADACNTVWMPEYGREYWDAHQVDRRLSLEQLAEIAREHRRREDELVLEANRFLFVDTDATTTLQFSLDYHGTADPELVAMADATRDRYDLFFLCGTDVPYDDTADRSGEQHRQVFQRKIEADLLGRRIPFLRLGGDVTQRVETVQRVLRRWDPFESAAEQLIRLE